MMERRVDLPQPEGPSTVRNSCGATSSEIASRAGTGWSRVRHCLATARTSMWAAVTARILSRPVGRCEGHWDRSRVLRGPRRQAGQSIDGTLRPRCRPAGARSSRRSIPTSCRRPLDALAAELGSPSCGYPPTRIRWARLLSRSRRSATRPRGSISTPTAARRRSPRPWPRRSGVSPAQLVFGNGGDEIITLLVRALLEPGDEVVVPEPSFEPYTTTALLAGGVVVASPLRDYRIDLDDVLARIGPRAKLVCLTSPHNPTGTVLERSAWERFCARCPRRRHGAPRRGVHRLHRGAGPRCGRSWRPLGLRPESLVLLRTFSKITGLAGLRVGYAIAAPAVDRAAGASAGAIQRRAAGAGGRGGGQCADAGASGRDAPGGLGGAAGAGRGLRGPRSDSSADRGELLPGPPGTADAPGGGGPPGAGRAGARRRRGRLPRASAHQRRHLKSRTRVCWTRSTAPSPAEREPAPTASSCSSGSAWPRAWPSGGPAGARPPLPSSSTSASPASRPSPPRAAMPPSSPG